MSGVRAITQRILLYDGDCGFCQRWCDWARRRRADEVVTFQPCQAAVELRAQASIGDSDCERAAFLVEITDGRVTRTRSAAAAINGVLRVLPGGRNRLWRAIGRLYPVPGIRQIEEWGYRWIARNRGRLAKRSCRV